MSEPAPIPYLRGVTLSPLVIQGMELVRHPGFCNFLPQAQYIQENTRSNVACFMAITTWITFQINLQVD